MHRELQVSQPFLRSQTGYYYYYVWYQNRRLYRFTGVKNKKKALQVIFWSNNRWKVETCGEVECYSKTAT